MCVICRTQNNEIYIHLPKEYLNAKYFFLPCVAISHSLAIAEDSFTPWLIHDEGKFVVSIFKEFIIYILFKYIYIEIKKILEDA